MSRSAANHLRGGLKDLRMDMFLAHEIKFAVMRKRKHGCENNKPEIYKNLLEVRVFFEVLERIDAVLSVAIPLLVLLRFLVVKKR